MSLQQTPRRQEWTGLLAGGFFGLTLILLTNISPSFATFGGIFAGINIFLFLCILFSPFFLIYGFFEPKRRVSTAAAVIVYILSAILVGFMIAYLARGDNYYSGLIVMPNEVSWVVVAIIATLLLIPLINFFASFPIAIWLGSLIYGKVYLTSHFSKTVIGSPLFAVPIFVILGCEISRTLQSRQSIAYIFSKTEGTLTQQRLPKGKVPLKRLLATTIAFLTLSSMVAAAFGFWNETEEANITYISNFQLAPFIYHEGSYSFHLKVSFSLVNVRGKTVPAEGTAELALFDKNGTSIYNRQFSFTQKSFMSQANNYWVCTCYVSGQSLISYIVAKAKSVTVLPRLAETVNSGYATLKVHLNNGKKTLTATTSTRYLLDTNSLMRLYFQNDIAILQAELNKQWPIRASITQYFKLGNYGWMVVGRTGGGIVIYPGKIYDWYILQSIDGGECWDIMWKGDSCPTFYIEILNEKEVRIKTPYGIFLTRDEGKTWEKQ